ncbi:UDP-Glc:alpha-D-GlcNAc-diphosphoundecaprenol beta-1,3-glucosyltransferase WfgD [compost metagenome]
MNFARPPRFTGTDHRRDHRRLADSDPILLKPLFNIYQRKVHRLTRTLRPHELYENGPENPVFLNRIGLFLTSSETSDPVFAEFRLARERARLEVTGKPIELDVGHYRSRVSDYERRQYALALARYDPKAAAAWLIEGEWDLKAAFALAAGDLAAGFAAAGRLSADIKKSKDLHVILAALHSHANEFQQSRQYLKSLLTDARNLDSASNSPLSLLDFLGQNGDLAPSTPADGALVSVIICAYNAAPFIGAALRSVLNQNYPNVEIISIDDGSQDHTFEQMRQIADENPRITAHRFANNGAYASRNIGLRLARGEFITFLDADDIMLPHRISSQLAALEHSGAAATVSRLIRISEDGRLAAPRIYPFVRHNPCSLMMRRSTAVTVGDFDESRFGADEEYEHRIALRLGKSALLRTAGIHTLALHRAGSLTQSPDSGLATMAGRQARIAYRESWIRRHRLLAAQGQAATL